MEHIFFFDTKGSAVAHTIDAPVFAVKAWKRGYYPIHTPRNAAELNNGIPAHVLEAALIGSAFAMTIRQYYSRTHAWRVFAQLVADYPSFAVFFGGE